MQVHLIRAQLLQAQAAQAVAVQVETSVRQDIQTASLELLTLAAVVAVVMLETY